jgi:hypothetical protein
MQNKFLSESLNMSKIILKLQNHFLTLHSEFKHELKNLWPPHVCLCWSKLYKTTYCKNVNDLPFVRYGDCSPLFSWTFNSFLFSKYMSVTVTYILCTNISTPTFTWYLESSQREPCAISPTHFSTILFLIGFLCLAI